MNANPSRRARILKIAQFSILLAIEAITCFTILGSLPITPTIVATLSMIPVIITSILLDWKYGTLMGFVTGIFSLIVWTFMPPGPAAFVFTPFVKPGNFFSLVICLVPRTLTGTFSGLIYQGILKALHAKKYKYPLGISIAAAVGSLTNTILVLLGIYLFFGKPYAEAYGMSYEALLGAIGVVIGTNGVAELITSIIISNSVCLIVGKYITKTMEDYRS